MTVQDVIRKLSYDNTAYGEHCTEEVRKVAIQALEEVEQYRALGTVEEIEPYIRLAEKLNICDLVSENKRLSNKIQFLEIELKEAREKQPQADKWIPCEVQDIIDTIISHNEIVALWVEEETEDVRYDKQIWRGMAWDIPNSYKGCQFVKIFGTVPESIVEADTINIRIETPQPYKKEGAEND